MLAAAESSQRHQTWCQDYLMTHVPNLAVGSEAVDAYGFSVGEGILRTSKSPFYINKIKHSIVAIISFSQI